MMMRNKFEFLKEIVGKNIDILLVSESKIDDTFPIGQFTMQHYHTPFREDRNGKGGGLILFIRNHIPCRRIHLDFYPKIEAIVIEINLRKRKWLLFGLYNPHKDMIANHLESVGKQINILCEKYENFMLVCEDEMQFFLQYIQSQKFSKSQNLFQKYRKSNMC